MSKQKGFTLIELMVTVAILTIIVTIATPSGKDFLANRRASAQAREILNAFHDSRMKAINNGSNQNLTFCAGRNGIVAVAGATEFNKQPFTTIREGWVDKDNPGTIVVKVEKHANIISNTNSQTITFSSRGTATSASVETFRKEGGNILRTYKVAVNSLGLVRVVK